MDDEALPDRGESGCKVCCVGGQDCSITLWAVSVKVNRRYRVGRYRWEFDHISSTRLHLLVYASRRSIGLARQKFGTGRTN